MAVLQEIALCLNVVNAINDPVRLVFEQRFRAAQRKELISSIDCDPWRYFSKAALACNDFRNPNISQCSDRMPLFDSISVLPVRKSPQTHIQRRQSDLIKIDEADAADARAHQDRSWTIM